MSRSSNVVIEFMNRVVARIMRSAVATRKQSPLALVVAVLSPHRLTTRMRRNDICVTLFVQRFRSTR